MGDFIRYDVREVDLNKPLWRTHTGVLLAVGDDGANRFGAILHRDGVPVDFAGQAVAVTGYFMRPDGETVVCKGVQNGSMVYVDLPAACYTQSGTFSLAVKVSSTDVTETVRVIDGVIRLTQTDVIVDPGEVVPSLDDLLAHIAEMEAVSQAAPPIVHVVMGDVVTISDAAAGNARSVLSYITPAMVGEGDPSPDNVRALSPRYSVHLWHEMAHDESADFVLSAALDGVYAGSLNWVSGTLTITHKFVTIDGSANWQLGTNNIFVKCNDIAESASLFCNQFIDSPSTPVASLAANQVRQGATYTNVVFGNPGNALTKEQWKERANANPIQLVYTLATPTVIQLNGKQNVNMLYRNNALWSDTGKTQVEYTADTKLYIDSKFDALQNAILAQGVNI